MRKHKKVGQIGRYENKAWQILEVDEFLELYRAKEIGRAFATWIPMNLVA